MKQWWDELNVFGSLSSISAKKLNIWEMKLKDVFGHLETKMATLVETIELLDHKEAKKELSLVHNLSDIFEGSEPNNIG